MKDKCGQEITVGCYLAYGHALGRCAGLRIGKVLAIKEDVERDYKGNPTTHEPWDCQRQCKGTPTTIPLYRITVMGVDDDWSSCYWLNDDNHKPKLQQKKGTLQFPNRTIVLSSEQVPEGYRQMLDAYEA